MVLTLYSDSFPKQLQPFGFYSEDVIFPVRYELYLYMLFR
jgi:hypothetical protein